MVTIAEQPGPSAAPPVRLTWRNYVTLALLLAVAALSFIDRQIFTLFQDDIKAELELSDSQLGLLTGLSFALFYAVAAFPVARYADRGDRRKVIAVSVIVWSMATALCGVAHSFWTMILARVFLASGEAGAGPAANSLLVEVFPPHRRVLVISTVLAASAVGLSGGLALGGWLSQWYGWREVFLIVGLPGIVLGLLVLLFVQEPRRDDTAAVTAARGAEAIPVREVLRTMLGNPSLRWVMLLLSMVPITGFALILWGPSFFQRVHGMSKEATGLWLGGAMLAGLVVGNILAGLLGDKYGTANPRFNGWFAGIGLLIAFPFALLFAWTESANLALLAFVVVKFMMTLHLGPIIALSFAQVPVRMRATMSATINMFIGLAGTGVGGTLAGVLSQAYTPTWGELSLRPALATISVCLLVGGLAAIMAGRTARPLTDQT
ncbi:MAG: MFS transporter [Novosphingobium sp.]|nr:MFS transporter [Novosphingobium sp.]